MESNGHSNTCPKLHLACSCACLHCPVLSCTEKEGKREERGEREGERRRKKFGRQGRPAKAFWKKFAIKGQGTGAVRPAKKVDLQSGTVRDSPGHQLS